MDRLIPKVVPQMQFNREISWLKFNSRVLDQCLKSNPPLESLKFLSIYATNLDEFYMIRVSGLLKILKNNSNTKIAPDKQLDAITSYIHEELELVEKIYTKTKKDLEKNEIEIIEDIKLLNKKEKEVAQLIFDDYIYPVIVAILIDEEKNFPHLNSLSFGLCLQLEIQNKIQFAILRIPRVLKRFLKVSEKRYILIEEVVRANVKNIFSGTKIRGCISFRVSRDADVELAKIDALEFLDLLSEDIKQRSFSDFVRLEINTTKIETKASTEAIVEFLRKNLNLTKNHIYKYKIPLNLGTFLQLVNNPEFKHLLAKEHTAYIKPYLRNEKNIFDEALKRDILIFQPFESFDPIVKLIKQSAKDKNTLSIKITLYRVGADSPIIEALIEAAKSIQITAVVELKARFDEENNIHWARELENAGADVIYGIEDLKIHAKIALIIKEIDGQIQECVHISSGNYNVRNAKIYTDISYITRKKEIIKDAINFFHSLTLKTAKTTKLNYLIMAPTQIKDEILTLIKIEEGKGKEGQIILKANALADHDIIEALYKASEKGVEVKLIIRGICCLKPQKNIEVISIIGQYLEHARIYFFKNSGIYFSSADLMPRNLTSRVELLVPLKDNKKLLAVLETELKDNALAYKLLPDGNYSAIDSKGLKINSQEEFFKIMQNLD